MKLTKALGLSAAGLCLALSAQTALAKSTSRAQITETIHTFYKNFTLPTPVSNLELINKSTTSDWQSCQNGTGCRGQEVSAKTFAGFAQMLPNMHHEIKEILIDGNKVVVRGEMTGTPAGDFFGVPHTGKSFKIMTIDVHTMRDGKIAHTEHLEDWAGALGQLRGN